MRAKEQNPNAHWLSDEDLASPSCAKPEEVGKKPKGKDPLIILAWNILDDLREKVKMVNKMSKEDTGDFWY